LLLLLNGEAGRQPGRQGRRPLNVTLNRPEALLQKPQSIVAASLTTRCPIYTIRSNPDQNKSFCTESCSSFGRTENLPRRVRSKERIAARPQDQFAKELRQKSAKLTQRITSPSPTSPQGRSLRFSSRATRLVVRLEPVLSVLRARRHKPIRPPQLHLRQQFHARRRKRQTPRVRLR